jgi:hypothetical protein
MMPFQQHSRSRSCCSEFSLRRGLRKSISTGGAHRSIHATKQYLGLCAAAVADRRDLLQRRLACQIRGKRVEFVLAAEHSVRH